MQTGVIRMHDNPSDMRAKLASATEAGRAAIQSLQERQHVWANGVADGIAAEEIGAAIETMRKVIGNLPGTTGAGTKDD